MDLADKLSGGGVTADSILFGGGPPHAAPDVPLDVAPHIIGQSWRETFGKDLAVGARDFAIRAFLLLLVMLSSSHVVIAAHHRAAPPRPRGGRPALAG